MLGESCASAHLANAAVCNICVTSGLPVIQPESIASFSEAATSHNGTLSCILFLPWDLFCLFSASVKNSLSSPLHCAPAEVENQRRNVVGRGWHEFNLHVHRLSKELRVTIYFSLIGELQGRLSRRMHD
jgi:hypothetical protein